jgi:hypothetical protein
MFSLAFGVTLTISHNLYSVKRMMFYYWQRGPCPQRWGAFCAASSDWQQQELPNFKVDVQAFLWLGVPGISSCCSPQAQVCRVADSLLSLDFMESLDAGCVSLGMWFTNSTIVAP